MSYILSISTRTVHSSLSTDNRCKVLKAENKKMFNTLEDALSDMPRGDKPTKKCAICEKKGLFAQNT